MKQHEDGGASPRDMDAWFTPGRFAIILAALIFLTFFNIITGAQTFFLRDFGVYTYPNAQYYRECFWRGEIPLWNPLNFCGIPLVAQWNTSMLYPPSLFYLVFPLSWSLAVFNVAHLFWAGLGMYFLARRWLGNNFAASVAGVVFAYNGLSWYMLMWISNLAAWAWMPWVVLTLERAWREGGKHIVTAALAGTLQMLTGAPEIILLTWLFCGALWLGQCFRKTISWPGALRRCAVAGILVTGLSAAQLLPFLDLLKHSHRDVGYGDTGWEMPVSGLANFIEPLFHCFNGGHEIFVQHDQYWTASYYMGVGTLLLAAVAVWRVRDGRVWLLAIATLASVLMALGKYGGLYTVVKTLLPQLGFMRYPIKFVVLTVFTVPLLAGFGARWVQEAAADSARKRKTLLACALVLLALLAIIVWIEWRYPMAQDDWPATWHNALVRAAFVVLVPGILIGLRRTAERKLHLLLRNVLLLLLWMDVFTHAHDLSPAVNPAVYTPGLMRAELKLDPHPQVGEPRMMETAAAAEQVRFTALSKPEADYWCRRLSMYDNCNLLDGVPKIDGFYSLYLRNIAEVIGLIYGYDAQNIDLKGLKDFLGVAYISDTNKSALDWVMRTNYLPLVTAGQKPVFAPDQKTLGYLTSPDFDPRKFVILPEDTRDRLAITNITDAKISSPRIEARRLSMNVTASAPSMVVVAQCFYHPWRAYVDGKPAEIFRANYAFQALQIPAGQHFVSLVYEDEIFRLGLAISLVTLVVCASFWLRAKAAARMAARASPAAV